MSKIIRLIAVSALSVAMMVMSTTAIALAAAGPTSAAPASFSCATSEYYMSNKIGWAFFNTSTDRLQVTSRKYLMVCANKTVGSQVELQDGYTGNCLTYAGPATGSGAVGYIDETSCTGKASQTWTLLSNEHMYNNYMGSGYCLTGPKLNGEPFMETCGGNNIEGSQDWVIAS